LSVLLESLLVSATQQQKCVLSNKGIYRKFSIWDTVSNISWVLVNSEPLMEFEGPTLRKIIDIGGIGVHEPKPLDEEWNRILNLRKQTILISFGTVAQSKFMPESMKKAIINVVNFPNITFIWKYEEPNDAMFKGIDNLIASEWTPQSCLLADKRLTLFITHGGAGSMMESALRAKPLIVVPLFGDQTRNAKLMEKFGFGEVYGHTHLDKVRNFRYQTAATRMSRLLARRPFSPGEKLVKTVELAAEFGNLPELRAAGRNLGYIAYYNLDLLLIIAAFSVIFTVFLLCIIHRVFVRFFITVKVKVQ
uniref:UDP-glucuronosyltransferase n=1 Tax=Haemonchus placei TaxID=6290 RepID=A0A0N4VUQ7_HAEPC